MNPDKALFGAFIGFFPVADSFPITITSDDARDFESNNPVLPLLLIESFIHPFETEDFDPELTEYTPCFKIVAAQFVAFVWWRVGLLAYTYELATYDLAGSQIAKITIAGQQIKDVRFAATQPLEQRVATVENPNLIYSSYGLSNLAGTDFQADASRSDIFVIEDNGNISN